MARRGIKIYSSKTGEAGFSSLYRKFSDYEHSVNAVSVAVTRNVAKQIRRDTRNNIDQSLQRQSGILRRSVYFRRRYRKAPTYEVGVGAEYAKYPEFGTGVHNILGEGRTDEWIYKSDMDGNFYTTTGQEPQLFFNDALDKNLQKFPKLVAHGVEMVLK